ncbi:hypothetical protein BAU15_00330 [Enterococcus sp. JM4C]|uniref:WxL domain-containing protein n=1 Tax=Candidatus Enterococcus huntleyi TaxID=1857217 RepID=UPI00137AA406|nr:WxL domain-containing protein [Enterococcus sp. JM4C]KAF1299126.1 hypothetical protein BAU15_00330 [Enterococcus sp. JM4C]
MKKQVAYSLLTTLILSGMGISASAAEQSITSNGVVEFIPGTGITEPIDPDVDPTNPETVGPVTPIDPTDPEGKPTPGTAGPLSIDFASSFDFGLNKITNKTMDYYARAQKFSNGTAARANYVQVSDNRGTNAGWQLTVTQQTQLTATTKTANDVLTGAVISLSEAAVNSLATSAAPTPEAQVKLTPGEPEKVTTAAKDTGAGTWVTKWGSVEEVTEKNAAGEESQVAVNKAVKLTIPGATAKDAVKYASVLTWTLSDVPL